MQQQLDSGVTIGTAQTYRIICTRILLHNYMSVKE